MPINFGEIAHYNQQIADRYFLRAQIERDCGKNSEAEYHIQLAIRYSQAAKEQQIAKRQAPGSLIPTGRISGGRVELRRPRLRAIKPRRSSFATLGWTAIQSLSRRITTAIRQSVSRRENPLQGLSLN